MSGHRRLHDPDLRRARRPGRRCPAPAATTPATSAPRAPFALRYDATSPALSAVTAAGGDTVATVRWRAAADRGERSGSRARRGCGAASTRRLPGRGRALRGHRPAQPRALHVHGHGDRRRRERRTRPPRSRRTVSRLRGPSPGARVTAPPVLRWQTVRGRQLLQRPALPRHAESAERVADRHASCGCTAAGATAGPDCRLRPRPSTAGTCGRATGAAPSTATAGCSARAASRWSGRGRADDAPRCAACTSTSTRRCSATRGSLLHDGEGVTSPARDARLEACLRADVEVVLMSGRRKESVALPARLFGQRLVHLRGRLVFRPRRRGALADRRSRARRARDSIHDQIDAAGAPDLLLEHYAGRLEYHAPWHKDREVSHLFRGSWTRSRPTTCSRPTATAACAWSTTARRTGVRRRSDEVERLRVYHLLPAGATKAGAVAAHMRARGYERGRLRRRRRLARGPGRQRAGRHVLARGQRARARSLDPRGDRSARGERADRRGGLRAGRLRGRGHDARRGAVRRATGRVAVVALPVVVSLARRPPRSRRRPATRGHRRLACSEIGRSVQGRVLRVVRVGDPAAARKLLVVGCVHGDECAGRAVVDAASADGAAARDRGAARAQPQPGRPATGDARQRPRRRPQPQLVGRLARPRPAGDALPRRGASVLGARDAARSAR